jgi:hypothetical protein
VEAFEPHNHLECLPPAGQAPTSNYLLSGSASKAYFASEN